MSNPSAVLVARSSRSPNNLSAALSSPTETHAAAAGIFRSSASSPPWSFEECGEDDVSELEIAEDEPAESIELDETFTRRARYPGTVKVVVEKVTFWAHKEILVFASPFFEAALSGSWSETDRPPSISSIITISRPAPAKASTSNIAEGSSSQGHSHSDVDLDSDADARSDAGGTSFSGSEHDIDKGKEATSSKRAEHARQISLSKLQGDITGASAPNVDGQETSASQVRGDGSPKKLTKKFMKKRKVRSGSVEAVIVLKDEKATIFHDFLKHSYPHLNCLITWRNVEGLMNISHKLVVQSLQDQCTSFLLTHAAGNPVKAMRIAEIFDEEVIFRESSRFVLDNPEGWQDVATLSQSTQLKLERKRTWFLERVVKLGLTSIAKEYQCSASCPEPSVCARLLEERWKQGYQASMRFGACQPSILWRFLRMLEVSPPLALTQLACQNTAKNFAATLFDRMFSLGMRGSGTDSVTALRAMPTAAHARYFLYVTLKEPERRSKVRGRESINPL